MASAVLQVRKRSGATVPYQKQKIVQAVRLCLINGCKRSDNAATRELADRVSAKVEKLLRKIVAADVDVEFIQDLVEQTLMALGEHDAAREYILYREEHRKIREETVVDPKIAAAITEDRKFFASDLQLFQHYDKYSRFNHAEHRRETFVESVVGRQIPFMQRHLAKHGINVLTEAEWTELTQAILQARATPSMRLMQTAGPAADRCHMGIYNCSFAGISDLGYVHEGLYISMQGTGFAFSVESGFIDQLPTVALPKAGRTDVFRVPDSTEGWCDSVKLGLERMMAGYDFEFNYDDLRPAGSPLLTKGGTASGPAPLKQLHEAMRRIIHARRGRRLRDIDVHDIMCYIGFAGEMGGFRRAAMLSLSDLDSAEMQMAKFGSFWGDPLRTQRTMANNSAVYDDKPTFDQFMDEWLSLAKSKSGERGIFNRGALHTHQLPARRRAMYAGQRINWGTNPCGEAVLYPTGGLCNLSIGIVRPSDTVADLEEKVRLAAVFGTIQSTMTDFQYVGPVWKENAERERLLGVDLLGALDNSLLRATNPQREPILTHLREVVTATNREYAARLGINASVAATVIKPGGNSSVRWGTGQSMSGWLSEYMIRNVEVGSHNPMCAFLKDMGVPHEPSYRDPSTMIFSFPFPAPSGAFIVSDLVVDSAGNPTGTKPRRPALAQLEDWLAFKRSWTEHNPSCSIYVADDEWFAVGDWVWRHWDMVGGLAFFPLNGGIYKQAPLQPVTRKQFDAFVAKFPKIAWEKLPRYDAGTDHTSVLREKACAGDSCTV